jgi:uncharacterized repeat protein (TIGR03803 family)
MNMGNRFGLGLIIGLLTFFCLAVAPARSAAYPNYAVIHSFTDGSEDGLQPWYGGPVLSGPYLYGMVEDGRRDSNPPAYHYGGALFRMKTDGTGYQIIHDFGIDGYDGTSPRGALALLGSTLYGFTAYGGGYNGGTVFKIDTSGGGYQVLKRFTTNEPCNPYGTPVISGAMLFGMHSSEEIGGKGAIFTMDLAGGGYRILHDFVGNPSDGANPRNSLTLVGSKLYGMTPYGGSNGGGAGYGVIFSINTDGGGYQVLYNFAGYPKDGCLPTGSLTLVGSKLYGMTSGGGAANGPGVIFSINLDGSGYQVMLDFSTISGVGGPMGALTLVGSTLYGMTSHGGPGGASGVIFQIHPDGSGFQILHPFMDSTGDAGYSLGDLTFSRSGNTLYGWSYAGGSLGMGAVFSYQMGPAPKYNPGLLLMLTQ